MSSNNISPLFEQITQTIASHPVVLFMKGTAQRPLCGFSSFVVQALQKYHIDFTAIDILQDQELRQAIKDYSQWPTIPQLYIKGEFMGGADIVREMLTSGELLTTLDRHSITYTNLSQS